jgi:hypothetical protein
MIGHRRKARLNWLLRQLGGGGGVTGVRPVISGKEILDENGQALTIRGINQGTWGENFEVDADDIQALGANCIRTVFRWWGLYGGAGTDSRDDGAANYIDAANLAQQLQEIQWATERGMWVIVAFDSNCGQNGLQNVDTEAYCDPGGAYPTEGRNFFSDLTTREFFKTAWKALALALASTPRILAFELLPEPLEGRDSTYADDVRDFYRDVIAAIRTVDTETPFLIGSRDAYNITLADEAWLSERTDVIYTGNILSGKMTDVVDLPGYIKALTDMRDTRNVPVLVQQVGRETSADTTLMHLNGGLSALNANGVHWTYWQWHQNTTNPDTYALNYKDGVGGWVPKTAEIARVSYYCGQTYAALEAAAQAAATAAGGSLYYVKPDFSNITQDSAGATPVTAVGQPIGRIAPVVGSAGNIAQATGAARPLLGLVTATGRHAMVFDGSDDYLQFASMYWASGDDTTVIASGIPAETATNRVFLHCGAGTANARYPYLGLTAGDVGTASWRGDDTTMRQIDGALNLSDRPIVLSGTKIGADKKLFTNGVQEGSTNTDAVDAIASLTRIRVGSASTTTGYFSGPITMLFVGKTVTDGQRRDIERFGAYLAGAAYAEVAAPEAETVQSLGMFGGQFKVEDTDMEVPFLDLMDRARTVGILSAGYGNYGFGPLRVQSLVRSSNVVTVTLADAPGHAAGSFTAITGQPLTLHCITDPTFDAEGVQVTVASQTSFTYPNTGSDGAANIGGPSDVAAALLARVQLGASGHPIEDHRVILTNPQGGTTPDIAGTYTVTFTGTPPGSVSFTGCTTSGYSAGAASFNITVADPAILTLEMNSVPTNNSYRNPRIIPVGEDQTGATKLRPDFATHCGRGKVTRWMDAWKTNDNPVHKSWAQRPLINLGTGLPAEVVIDACNEVEHHSWFCLPAFAADDYVTGLATLAKTRLSAALDAIYEYTNEPWNPSFQQYNWLAAMSKKEVAGIYHGTYGYSEIASLSKAGGTATVVLDHPLPADFVTGLHIDAVMTDADFDASDVAITVTGADTFTYPVSAGTESASSLNGAIFGNLASTLLSGGMRNLERIRARMLGKVIYDQSQLIKTVYDGVLNGRAKVVLMWQCTTHGYGQVIRDTLEWLVAQYGPLADWCYAIGGAPYPRCSGTTSTDLADASIAEMDDLYAPSLHSIRYLANQHGVKVWCYEGGVDMVNVNVARTDAMFTSSEMRRAQEHCVRKVFSSGADLLVGYTTGQREVGNQGSFSWGLGESIADLLPIGTATAPKAQGLDDVLLLPPPAIDDPSQLPGTVPFIDIGTSVMASDDQSADGADGFNLINGMACFKSADSYCEKMFWADTAGTKNITIYGKHSGQFGSVNNAVRIYLDGVLKGTHALFDDNTDAFTGPAGGSASPTTFALTDVVEGWNVLHLRGPAGAQPDRIGVSRVTAP